MNRKGRRHAGLFLLLGYRRSASGIIAIGPAEVCGHKHTKRNTAALLLASHFGSITRLRKPITNSCVARENDRDRSVCRRFCECRYSADFLAAKFALTLTVPNYTIIFTV
jgi:hypothetical protein